MVCLQLPSRTKVRLETSISRVREVDDANLYDVVAASDFAISSGKVGRCTRGEVASAVPSCGAAQAAPVAPRPRRQPTRARIVRSDQGGGAARSRQVLLRLINEYLPAA